ncbi:hypothetical protein GCM10010187_73290 [Actinomadura coerulea]|nr:hypothetical protein GCM10010187_73290 [Actinomadura coerulea]
MLNVRPVTEPMGSVRPVPTFTVPVAVKAFAAPVSTQVSTPPLLLAAATEPLFSPVTGWMEGEGTPGKVLLRPAAQAGVVVRAPAVAVTAVMVRAILVIFRM